MIWISNLVGQPMGGKMVDNYIGDYHGLEQIPFHVIGSIQNTFSHLLLGFTAISLAYFQNSSKRYTISS